MKKLIFIFIMGLFCVELYSQQDPLFSQYMFNKLALNPGYAGSREAISGDIIYRNQWVGISGAPKTFSLSVHSPLRNEHLAVGITAYNDRLGAEISNTGVLGTLAYRVIFPESKLSFGLQGGFKYSNIDWSLINAKDPYDLLANPEKQKLVPDVNFGIYYYSTHFYAGFASKHLLQNQTVVIKDAKGENEITKLFAHFYFMGGYVMRINDDLYFRPSGFVKFVKNAPAQMDLNASFLIADRFWLGTSYRTSLGKMSYENQNALSFLTEINITNNWRIGYSYDMWLNELKSFNKGSHEIRIGFDFDIIQTIMRNPRFF